MDEHSWDIGTRVSYTDPQGTTHYGTVEQQRRGWVMLDLEQPIETKQGWSTSKMMVRTGQVQQA